MEKGRTALQATRNVLLCIGGALLFLLIVYIAVYHDKDWRHLWLPISITDDEVMYNRQVAGILAGGMPDGYFGYNETYAAIGRFSVWGPVLMYLYALPGTLVGVGVNTLVWCNVFFVVLGWAFFVKGTRLTWKRQLVFAAAFFCLWFPLRQTFSGMSEGLQYCCALAIIGASAALQRKKCLSWFVIAVVFCAITTLTRAYTLLFWIFPITALWKSRRSWAWTGIVLAVLSAVGYFVVSVWFSSPYFAGGGIDYTGLDLLAQGSPIEAFFYEVGRMQEEFQELWELYIHPVLQDQGRTFFSTCALLVIAAVCLVLDHRKKRPVILKALVLLCTIVSTIMLFTLYDAGAFQRQFALLDVLLLSVLVYENRGYTLTSLLVSFLMLPISFDRGTLPTYRADMDEQIQIVNQALQKSQTEEKTTTPWDHTLAYAYADGVFHGYLYGVPAGMGIQFDFNTYIADPANPVHSRYAMVGHGTDAEARLLADGWQELVSTDNLVVYEQRNEK